MSSTNHTQNIDTLGYKTPFFLFSKDKIVKKYHEFTDAFPGAVIYYAMKANSETDVLKTLLKAGSSFEVASVYELRQLKELNVPADKILFGSSIKPLEHIREFAEYGVNLFAFDSSSELEKIAAAAPGSNVYVRMTANDSGSVFKFSEKFGTPREHVVPLLERARDLGLVPYGASFHVGSQASNPRAWAEALEALAGPMNTLKEAGIELQIINIGGGHPCAYESASEDISLAQIAKHTYAAYEKLPYQPKLLLEPGRGIIAETGVLVTSVIARVERNEHTWLFLDAGVYNGLFETMAYQGSTRYKVRSLRPTHDAGESMFALAGPTGDSPDVMTREALLPADISVGDKVIFRDAGAYSTVVTSTFNGFPKPEVYFVDTNP